MGKNIGRLPTTRNPLRSGEEDPLVAKHWEMASKKIQKALSKGDKVRAELYPRKTFDRPERW